MCTAEHKELASARRPFN